MMKRVLVTGANGFVGRSTCNYLLAAGWQVRGTVRELNSQDLPKNVEPVVTGDISEYNDWKESLKDVDAVVHLVARTHVMQEQTKNPLPLYRKINVLGTQRLLEGCCGGSVKRFLFVSSIKAVGESSLRCYAEENDCRPEDAYGTSKLEAERLVVSTASKLSIQSVILRPPLVYGPGVSGNFQRILKAVDRGLPLPLGLVNNQRSLLYVEDLAAAITHCLNHERAANRTFHLAGPSPISTRELVEQMSQALGRRSRLIPVPISLLCVLGLLTRKQDQISRLVDSLTVSTSNIERATQWTPQFSISQGLAATVQHYRAA